MTRRKSNRQQERERLIPRVKAISLQMKASYGARLISAELVAQGKFCGRVKAGSFTKLAGIAAKQKKKNSKQQLTTRIIFR